VDATFPTATLVRPSLIYGPGDHFFTRFAALAKVSPVLPVIGGGRTRFQLLHIDEAIRTLQALLERPGTVGATLALVGPETFTFREFLERMLRLLGRHRLILPLPFPMAEALAAAFERLPHPPLTREEVRLLRTDKVAGDLPTLAALGLAARRLDAGLPASLRVSRRPGV
jgi:NADH dehydrogenase